MEIGIFLTPDPLVPELTNPQAFNRYAYVLNNPIRYTDPTGHAPVGPDGTVRDEEGEVIEEIEVPESAVEITVLDKIIDFFSPGYISAKKATANLKNGNMMAAERYFQAAVQQGFWGRLQQAPMMTIGGMSIIGKTPNTPKAKSIPKDVKTFDSKRAAFRQAKRDAGIPTSQTHQTHRKGLKADALDTRRSATEYDFGNGQKIQDHPLGHTFKDGSIYDKSHFNNHGFGGTNWHYEY